MIAVLVTCPSAAAAKKIADTLVRERLAACVNVVPGVASVFAWKGRLERAKEYLLVIKSRRSLFERLRRRVKSLHPYEVPEIIGLPIAAGDADYLRWIRKETRA